MDELIYEVDGNMGKTLKVYEAKCAISITSGIKAALFGGGMLNGNNEFYYKDITSVQFKNLGMTSGYMQFEYPGSHSGNKNYTSENSFAFSATVGTEKHRKLRDRMQEVYEDIQKRVRDAKNVNNTPIQTISPAGELKEFKELLDLGLISQEEFDIKKKQILGL